MIDRKRTIEIQGESPNRHSLLQSIVVSQIALLVSELLRHLREVRAMAGLVAGPKQHEVWQQC